MDVSEIDKDVYRRQIGEKLCTAVYGSPDRSVKSLGHPALFVLAGGRGSRLGGLPKGLIRLEEGETVLDRLLRLSSGLAFVGTNNPEWYERFDVPLVGDIVRNKGAPGGVVTGLAVAPTEWVAIVACDMPFVTIEMLELLCARRRAGIDAVCFSRGGELEPLVGVYRRALCFDWAPRLGGDPSLRELLSSVRVDVVEAAEPARLASLNWPADLRNAAECFRSTAVAGTVIP